MRKPTKGVIRGGVGVHYSLKTAQTGGADLKKQAHTVYPYPSDAYAGLFYKTEGFKRVFGRVI